MKSRNQKIIPRIEEFVLQIKKPISRDVETFSRKQKTDLCDCESTLTEQKSSEPCRRIRLSETQFENKTSGKSGRRRTAALAVLAVLMVLTVLCLFCACGKADISAYGDQTITIHGLQEEDFTVTPAELMELKCVSRQDTGATAKAGTVKAYGPLLTTFLEHYGFSLEQIDRVRFYCKDEYKVVLKDEYLTDYDIILSVASGSEALGEKEQPLRILVPEAESSKWAYGITDIEFELKE